MAISTFLLFLSERRKRAETVFFRLSVVRMRRCCCCCFVTPRRHTPRPAAPNGALRRQQRRRRSLQAHPPPSSSIPTVQPPSSSPSSSLFVVKEFWYHFGHFLCPRRGKRFRRPPPASIRAVDQLLLLQFPPRLRPPPSGRVVWERGEEWRGARRSPKGQVKSFPRGCRGRRFSPFRGRLVVTFLLPPVGGDVFAAAGWW